MEIAVAILATIAMFWGIVKRLTELTQLTQLVASYEEENEA